MERTIFMLKDKSPIVYSYESLPELRFEMKLRTKIVETAHALLRSNSAFATFEKSKCNPMFWNLTEYGGFKLRSGVLPSTAIRDIFTNGSLYAFECATAKVIVLYKAVLDSIGEYSFNRYFTDLLLWDWNYDKDLRLTTINTTRESYPGDILYFKNPDVNPDTTEWQGENVVKLDDNLYYGHGIGITNANGIIAALNKHRKPNSTQSAYLMDQVTYLDFKYLYHLSADNGAESIPRYNSNFISAKIGFSRYVRVFE
ncbi:protein-glutamine gamma-glutamyltransferase [Cohnella sp.]|uniref:protein-glutamine gamma-glutamyltransferase n=1 Tax=Cohnella sp. TaxID=1883426 RepID=UPI0035682B1C